MLLGLFGLGRLFSFGLGWQGATTKLARFEVKGWGLISSQEDPRPTS